MNSFGRIFRVSIFGESHGESVGVLLDGVPAGLPISMDDFGADIARRQGGTVAGATARSEKDIPHIFSGVYEGHTTGAPIAIIFRNENARSEDYTALKSSPRPSHADWTGQHKYGGFADPRGGGHFSGRLTLPLVAAGVVAKKIVGAKIEARLIEVGGQSDPAHFDDTILSAIAEADSVGGIIECRAEGITAGLGEPFFDSVESVISHLLFSIPAVKGVEFGAGFSAARLRGSQNNDPILDASGATLTNNAGGIAGGISNGNELIIRVAVKPTPSIAAVQRTYNTATGHMEELSIGGRHDACIALRAVVVVEAAVAIALADFKFMANNNLSH